jgi:hypothetical protein
VFGDARREPDIFNIEEKTMDHGQGIQNKALRDPGAPDHTLHMQIDDFGPMLATLDECGHRVERIAESLLGVIPQPAQAAAAVALPDAAEGPLTRRIERRHHEFSRALSRLIEGISRIEGKIA